MGVDQPRADRGASHQPQIRRRTRRQPLPKRRAGVLHLRTDARKAFIGQLANADLVEIAGIPAAIMAQIGPFARHRADRTRQIARGFPGQEIGQIHELPGVCEDLGAVFLQPKQLRRLHLGRDAAADEIQHPVARLVDPRRLSARAVVHPDHDIAFGMGRIADRQGHAAFAQHDKRTGRVKADAANIGGRNPGLCHRPARRGTDRAPDILARLFDDPAGAVPSRRPWRSKTPARALPVPTSTPRRKSPLRAIASSLAAAGAVLARGRRAAPHPWKAG